MENRLQKVKEAAAYIRDQTGLEPDFGLILGSGLGDLAEEIENPVFIDYKAIPHFPVSTVAGHKGRLVLGTLNGRKVAALQGRIHYYEGYTMQEVTFPVYVMKMLGAKLLIVTNACGGINRSFRPGDLMLIADHLNLTGDNPLIGPNEEELGPRFPDMSRAYSPRLRQEALKVASSLGISLQQGVYAGISGPNYMTPSELIMLAKLGADALGMSTVPEVVAANHAGLEVLGIACVTDRAVGEELEPLTHEQVIEVANRTRPKFIRLVKEIIGGVTL